MNTETKLYPFRPQEAAIHPERVITRNGKTVRSLKFHHKGKSFPLSADIDGYYDWSGRKVDVCYTEHGTFYYETANRQHPLDLFMTTPPEDKPAPPKPAEEVAEHSDIIRVNKFISIMEAVILFPEVDNAVKFNAVCSGTTRRERDDAIARIATAEQEVSRLTRERDEARDGYNHLVEENNEKQEVIEAIKAQLATLRGELAEVKKAHTWIPVSEGMPTEADGMVMKYGREPSVLISPPLVLWVTATSIGAHPWNTPPQDAVGWLPFSFLPPLPTPPDSEEEYNRWEQEQGDGIHMGDKRTLIKAAFLAGQASREGGAK